MELAQSEYFPAVFEMPFRTILLEAHSPVENGWRTAPARRTFYERDHPGILRPRGASLRTYRDRKVTFVIQHWEGDWLLRGRGGELWNPPPEDWKLRCERDGPVAERAAGGREQGARGAWRRRPMRGGPCRRSQPRGGLWAKIPTMTEHVLPEVELDLVSYSSYDGMKDQLTLWRCLEEIRKHARTGPLFGEQAVFVGEMGIPENDAPNRIAERWDEYMGVMLAANVKYIVQWELYCNELNPKLNPRPKPPIKDPSHVRGFWLVKPDGALSESGKYFAGLWRRAGAATPS